MAPTWAEAEGAKPVHPPARASGPGMLIMPKKRTDLQSSDLVELRAEFGTSPSAAPASIPTATAPYTRCPFCEEAITEPVSRALQSLLNYWVQRARAGQALRPTDTLAVCQRHRDESHVIPEGARRGWPLALDFREVRRRVASPSSRYMRTMQDRVLSPTSSPFFHEARREREQIGPKTSSSAHEIETFVDRQCG